MNQDDAVCGTVLVGGTLMMAAIDGAVLFTLGAVGLGYLSCKAYADIANRPADTEYGEMEAHLTKEILAISKSNLDEPKKKAGIKQARDQLLMVQRRRQQNAAKLRGTMAQLVGIGVFAFPLLAPIYLGKWTMEKLTTEEQRERIAGKFVRKTPDEALDDAKARWAAL